MVLGTSLKLYLYHGGIVSKKQIKPIFCKNIHIYFHLLPFKAQLKPPEAHIMLFQR